MSDPWETAENAQVPPRVVFGQVFADSFYAVLEKGAGKVPFDPAIHSPDRRVTAIKIDLQPLERPDGSIPLVVAREMIAESPEWVSKVLPSLRALGVHPWSLNERWCQVELVETGRTFQSKQGETVKATTFKFLAFYDDQASCDAARATFYARGATAEQQSELPTPPANGNGKQREVAAKFLPALWVQAGKDAAKFLEAVAANPLTKQHFGPDSPEVLAIVTPF